MTWPFIVDFPIKNGSVHSYVAVDQRTYGTKVSNLSVHPRVGSIQDLNQPGVVHLLMADSFGESQMVGIYVYDKSWNILYIYVYIYIIS